MQAYSSQTCTNLHANNIGCMLASSVGAAAWFGSWPQNAKSRTHCAARPYRCAASHHLPSENAPHTPKYQANVSNQNMQMCARRNKEMQLKHVESSQLRFQTTAVECTPDHQHCTVCLSGNAEIRNDPATVSTWMACQCYHLSMFSRVNVLVVSSSANYCASA